MRSSHREQRTIIGAAVIEVKSQSEQAFHDRVGRLYMQYAILSRPVFKTGDVPPLGDGNRSVLMPSNLPVSALGFIKEQNPDRSGGLTNQSRRDFMQRATIP